MQIQLPELERLIASFCFISDSFFLTVAPKHLSFLRFVVFINMRLARTSASYWL